MVKRHDNYKYDTEYEARPEQKKRRVQRNRDRRAAIRAGKVHKGSGMDVHHTEDGIRIISKSRNRSIK